MESSLIACIVFVWLFGAGWVANRLRSVMPDHHLNADTKDTVKLAMGLVATMTALVLGLLVASAKGNYDADKTGLVTMSAKIVVLDRVLAHYGPESKSARELLRTVVGQMRNQLWPDRSHEALLDPSKSSSEALYDTIQAMAPGDDAQRQLKADAQRIGFDLGQMRWLMFEESGRSISLALLAVVVCWLSVLFFSFGLFAPPNTTAIASLFVAALAVSGAIFLILELDQPFSGFIQISEAPIEMAESHLGK